MDRGRRRWLGGLFVAALVAGPACIPAAGEQAVQGTPPRARDEAGERGAEAGASRSRVDGSRRAKELLADLTVRPHAPRTGYARDQFGHAWLDVDKNGCDTRDDILRRDLVGVQIAEGSRGCVVTRGRLADPYTGKDIEFERGHGASVDIDHVVALQDAWLTGASRWAQAERIALANDPLNLLAVAAAANRAKGSHNAAEWLPPSERYHCAYVARQIAVKAKYALSVTADEREAMSRVLSRCPDELAPVEDVPPPLPAEAATQRRAVEEPVAGRGEPAKPAKPAKGSRPLDPNYGSCKNAKAQGKGPYRRDVDPEYHYYRDGDGDGVVCE